MEINRTEVKRMPIKMHQICYFLAICEERNFTRAAQRCGVAQPSLTRAIQQLESDLGGPLFERASAAIHLTALGAFVHPEFVRIENAVARIEQIAAQRRRSPVTPAAVPPTARFTRTVAVVVIVIAILGVGLALRI